MTWRCRPSAENERGASIIEFALLSSVMFVMLFGILSYGEVLADYVQLRHRVGEMSRLVALGEDAADRQSIFVEESRKTIEGFIRDDPRCLTFNLTSLSATSMKLEIFYDYRENGECRIMPQVPFVPLPGSVGATNTFTVRN